MKTNAFVTGGSRGIGRAIVLKLAEQGLGCAFTYRDDETAAQETLSLAMAQHPGADVRAYRMDLTRGESIESALQQAILDFGGFLTVVSNAGIVKVNAAVLTTDEEWNEVMATNLTGPFHLLREFLMHLLSRKQGGRVIALSSIAAHGASGQVAYAASKAGLVAMIKCIAKEYGPKGITANVIAPGYIETGMTEDAVNTKLKQAWLQFCPMRRAGNPGDVAGLVAFLASPDAGFINGELLHVSGGLNDMP